MTEKKMIFGGVFNLAAAFMCLASVAFVLLDLGVWNFAESSLEGAEGIGLAVVFSLAVMIQFPAMALAMIFQAVSGAIMLLYPRRGVAVHKAVRILNVIFGVIAAGAGCFFAICYFDVGLVIWGVLTAAASVASLAAGIVGAVVNHNA